ncbi:MAG TPA: c-type cytochrome [Gaiellaceae bacterium]|nr:c-type cytochrome [Gaiellaceae bacterium]
MSSVDEKRAYFKRYKEDVEREGKPFFPYAMFHDTVMSLVVVAVIIGLACVWYFTADGTEAGAIGPWYAAEADPGTTNFIPRPDWYFYFLFYLLRIFKWPESVILGTVGIPTILMILLIGLPFIDRRRERRLLRRPVAILAAAITAVSMGVLTYKGATARESLGSEAVAAVDDWSQRQGGFSEEAHRGAEVFAQVGCLQCHTYLGSGSSNVGAPDLSNIGSSGQDAAFFARYVANPSQFGNNVMPSFENLGAENLAAIAAFLEASKGEQ